VAFGCKYPCPQRLEGHNGLFDKKDEVMKSVRWYVVAVTLLVLVLPAAVHAAPLIFFGEDQAAGGALPVPNSAAAQGNFLSNLVGVRVEDFEGIPLGTNFPFNVTFGADTATLTGTNTIGNTGIVSGGLVGRFPISGSQYLNVGSADTTSFGLTFSSPQAAFGFYGTDIGDFSGQLTISLDGGAPMIVPHGVAIANGSALFWGIIDTASPFTTVSFSNTGGSGDAFGFDDFTIGRREQVAAIPEPATMLLLSAGIGGLAVIRRRRK
jgi:hypothetical protein